MLISKEVEYFHGGNPFALRDNDDASSSKTGDSFEGSVPARYRSIIGGVNLERVKRDQRRAKKELVRAIIHRLRISLLNNGKGKTKER